MRTDDPLARLGHQLRDELRDVVGPPPPTGRLRRGRNRRRAGRLLVAAAVLAGAVVVAAQILPGSGLTIDPVGPPDEAQPDATSRPSPEVTSFDLPAELPMRLLAVRSNDPSFAIIDLRDGQVTTYPPGSSDLLADAIDGAGLLADGTIVIWQNGTVRTFTEGATEASLVHTPTELINPPGTAPSLRVVPSADGTAIWVVQIGSCCPYQVEGRAELVDLETGRASLTAELPPVSFPIAASPGGLLLNTLSFVDTGNGWLGEPGSHEWLLLGTDGELSSLGDGEVLSATGESGLVLTCESHEPRRGCALDLVDLSSREHRRVEPPVDGEWTAVTEPNVPGGSPGWDAVSPDGRVLLAIANRDRLAPQPFVSTTGETPLVRSF